MSAVVTVGLVGGLVVGLAEPTGRGAEVSARPGQATVASVVDGDTIVVRADGREETVRLIGIDTPETVHPDRPPECFGPQASARLTELLPSGTEVLLERDVEARDRFGRLLAYVRRRADHQLVNLTMVAEGYADARVFGDNVALSDVLAGAEARARADGLGLWGACGSPDVPLDPPVSADDGAG